MVWGEQNDIGNTVGQGDTVTEADRPAILIQEEEEEERGDGDDPNTLDDIVGSTSDADVHQVATRCKSEKS